MSDQLQNTFGETTVNRDDMLKLLADCGSQSAAYHNHKENSAWASLALAVVVIAQIVTIVIRDGMAGDITRFAASTAILLIGVTAFSFMNAQFRLRAFAGNVSGACLLLRLRIINGADVLMAIPDTIVNDTGRQASHVLPSAVLECAKELEAKGTRGRSHLEWYAKGILILLTITGAASVMLNS